MAGEETFDLIRKCAMTSVAKCVAIKMIDDLSTAIVYKKLQVGFLFI
jgi:hypothetical protein